MTTKGTVLVIDDDPDFSEVVRIALQSDGFRVLTAADGEQGLALMREQKPDLVFLDIIMVVPTEGVYVSEVMAADPELRDVPLVIVSSIIDSPYAAQFPQDRYLHTKMFLNKPVSIPKLLEIANKYAVAC
ncbi:MAG: response regulator [Anaerolineae bacterium]|nr:response regulator [Anaerolineae bacterium]